MTYLFSGQMLTTYLNDKMKMLKTSISQTNSVQKLDEKSQKLKTDYLVDLCVLRREEATLTPREDAKGVEVTVSIPLEGNTSLLDLHPASHGARVSVAGSISRLPSPVFQTDEQKAQDQRPKLILSNVFNPAPSKEDVRAWAKETVDLVEKGLRAFEQPIAEHNRKITEGIDGWIEDRRQLLAGADSLKGDLGTGI